MSDFLQRFGEQQPDGSYEFSNVREGLIVAMLSIGTLIGALCGAPLADRYGRRKAMQIDCVVFSFVASSSRNWPPSLIKLHFSVLASSFNALRSPLGNRSW